MNEARGTENILHSGFSSQRIDSLIASTQQYWDRARATADFKAIQSEVATDVPLVPLRQTKDHVLSTDSVAGSKYLTDGSGIWRLWELSWI